MVMVIERLRTDTMSVSTEGTELIFERTFDAPRDLVWKAFMDPALIPRWWGPHGTTTTVTEMDVRVGGAWRYVSHASGRDDVTFYGKYLAIEPPTSFTWTFLFEVEGFGEQGGPGTFTFEDVAGRTRVRTSSHFPSVEALEGALSGGMIGGAVETWDRLEAFLAEG